MIPPKYIYEGDTEKARNLRGFAQSQLEILGRAMTFQGLKQDKRMVTFSDGTVIKAEIDHGLGKATIYCPPLVAVEEEVEKEGEAAIVESAGGTLRQGATIGELAAILCCNKQGATAPIELCEGTILPFNPPAIVGNVLPFPGEKHEYQVRGGIHPYVWTVTGDDYFFKDEESAHIYETGGHVQAPLCHGGRWHGYYGGAEGITGMLFMLMGGVPINKDMCERGGGTLYLYRGTVEVYTEAACGGRLVVEDVCGNVAEMVLERPSDVPVAWDSDNSISEIDPSESDQPIYIEGGIGPYTWEVEPSDKYDLGTVETMGAANTLSAHADSCGTCVITVTDGCGSVCVGYIKNTAGQWNTTPKWEEYKYASPCADPAATCTEGASWNIPKPKTIVRDCKGDILEENTCCSGTSCSGESCTCSVGSGFFDFAYMCWAKEVSCEGYPCAYGDLYWGQVTDVAPELDPDTDCWIC